jgi:hypothetical protein
LLALHLGNIQKEAKQLSVLQIPHTQTYRQTLKQRRLAQ